MRQFHSFFWNILDCGVRPFSWLYVYFDLPWLLKKACKDVIFIYKIFRHNERIDIPWYVSFKENIIDMARLLIIESLWKAMILKTIRNDALGYIKMYLALSSILTKGIKKTMPTSTYGENWFILSEVVSCWRGRDASFSGCEVSRKAAQRLYRRYEEVSWVRVSNKRLRDKHFHNKWTNLPQTIFPCCAFCGWYFRISPAYPNNENLTLILTFVKFCPRHSLRCCWKEGAIEVWFSKCRIVE